MGEVVSGSAFDVDLIEYEKQLQDIASSFDEQLATLSQQHASDIAALQSEYQEGVNQITETLTQIGEDLGSKIDLLIEKTGSYVDEIVEALNNLQIDDVVMYEAVILIAGIMVFFVVCFLFWCAYKFFGLFF